MTFLPHKVDRPYLRTMVLMWLAVVGAAYTYCHAHMLVHDHAVVIPGAANVWLLSRWMFWPYILPIAFWLFHKAAQHIPSAAALAISALSALILAATHANLVNNVAGYEETFLSTFYYMMPIALGTYTLFVAASLLYVRKHPPIAVPDGREEQTIVVNKGRTIVWLKASEIDWMQSARNYIDVHSAGQTYILRNTLAKMAEELPEEQFVRIHRSYIVNRDAIEGINKNRDGSAQVTMKDGSELPCGRAHRDALAPAVSAAI